MRSWCNSGTSYANPDAATAVASKTLTYDNNGNLTAIGTSTFSWNYRNRLTQSGSGLATSSYGYDDTDARVWLKEGNTKTIFPNQLYNVVLGTTTSTSTKHIMVGDLLVSTIENVGTTTTSTTTAVVTTRFMVTDHLGSVSAVLTASGTVSEMIDAFPYGASRLDVKSGSYVGEKNKYAETQYDATANLNYAQARYQDAARGQFLSQDPMFLGDPRQQIHANPQLMNSYGYGRDNPIINKDPTGEVIPLVAILAVYGVAQLAVDAYDAYNINIRYADVTTPQEKGKSAFKAGFDLFTMGVGGAATKLGLKGYDFALSGVQATGDTLDYFFGRQIYQNMNYNQIQSQTSAQSRQQYAQNYNASFGLSTGAGGKAPDSNSLWVTPSGAVVTFGGQLVAGPTNKK
jgi:RHS repeat-associated protein